jgi:hypothetical protein
MDGVAARRSVGLGGVVLSRGLRRDLWDAESTKLSVTPTGNKSEVGRD